MYSDILTEILTFHRQKISFQESPSYLLKQTIQSHLFSIYSRLPGGSSHCLIVVHTVKTINKSRKLFLPQPERDVNIESGIFNVTELQRHS